MSRPRIALLAVAALLIPAVSSARRIKLPPPAITVSVQVDAKLRAKITIKNVTDKTLTVRSHVKTHERHYDWLTLELRYPTGTAKQCADDDSGYEVRTLTFVDDRDKSFPVDVELEPGKSITHTIDLQDWAKRKVNGGEKIRPGYYKVYATYDAQRETGVLPAYATSPEIEVRVPGKIRPGKDQMCPVKPEDW